MSRAEMEQLGWDELDILLVTGDAYVDHPSFGAALLGRWLVANGYRVGIVAQPRWDTAEDVMAMGRPALFAGVTAGALDSMLAHYTAFRKKRNDDAYTPGGQAGRRPNRASIVYTGLVRQAFSGLPVVIGGIEASLRRVVHYDFWAERIRRPILLDSKANLLVYGMAERALLEVAARLRKDPRPEAIHGVHGTASARVSPPDGARVVRLPSFQEIKDEPAKLMEATLAVERQVQEGDTWLVQDVDGRDVVLAPPALPLSTDELDSLYALPFSRRQHPAYTEPVPAFRMIQFSITAHRGCGGGCAFCSLALHQGRRIRSRSRRSILDEVQALKGHPSWSGVITDVGGPSANMWGARCTADPAACLRVSCLHPKPCPSFKTDQGSLAELLDSISQVPGVKHLRVSSGLRHDLAVTDPAYVRMVVGRFAGGQLKLAPEHSSGRVLNLMRKAPFEAFTDFLTIFERETRHAHKEQYVIPYLMSAFPGCTDDDMRALARWLKARGWRPRQVQCFIPTPGTVATAMYYAGIDPAGNPIHVARTDAERIRQHQFLVPSSSPKPAKGGRPGRPGNRPGTGKPGKGAKSAHPARKPAGKRLPRRRTS
ncbi:MAG: YgiQ family radical SAM protein [Nitrospiraceae bacterium]|nr:YgiQ family radical SAM protein [Nitrospiraceae bacterium]